MQEVYLALIFTFITFLVLFLVFFWLWRRQVTIKTKSSKKIEARVIGYTIFQRNKKPIVEYYVNGKRYKQYLRYYLTPIHRDTEYHDFVDDEDVKKEFLRDRHIYYANSFPGNWRKYWPIGSTMTVYYNPKNPKLGYVERYAGLLYYWLLWSIMLPIGWLVISLLIYFLNVK